MGAWGPAIFSDDLACDVRDQYRSLLEDQVADAEAERQVLDGLGSEDRDDGPVVWLALAATESKVGRLSDFVRSRALAIIDEGGDAARWAEADAATQRKRTAALAKLRAQLVGEQPPRRHLRAPKQKQTGLEVGDVLALRHRDLAILVRVVTLDQDRSFLSPVLGVLDRFGPDVPPIDELEAIPDRPRDETAPPLEQHRSLGAYVVVIPSKERWTDHGFELVGRVPSRPGDEHIPYDIFAGWSGLAARLRHLTDELLDGMP